MTAVLTPPVLARQVGAIQIAACFADTPEELDCHTWRWQCTCGTRSFCTFPTADDADRAGEGHVCREVE